jgi:hypothetical protein
MDSTRALVQSIVRELMDLNEKADSDLQTSWDKNDDRTAELLGYKAGLAKALAVVTNHHVAHMSEQFKKRKQSGPGS